MAKFHLFQTVKTELDHLIHGVSIAHEDLRNRLATAITLSVVADLIMTIAFYFLERGAKGSDIDSIWDAFYYTTATLTTIGSSQSNPVTTGGEVLTLVADIYAVTVISTIAGMFGAYFYHRTNERHLDAVAKKENDKKDA